MAAGDMAERANHDGDGESVSHSDAEKSERVRCVGIPVHADGAFAKKDQSKRADELSRELLRKVVHQGASRPGNEAPRCDREGFYPERKEKRQCFGEQGCGLVSEWPLTKHVPLLS